MVATKDIRLAEETVRDLRAQGQDERAAAVEALLAVAEATLVAPRGEPASGRFWTVREAARATGMPGDLIRQWIKSGSLAAVIQRGRTLVRAEDVFACMDAMPLAPIRPAPSPEQLEAGRRAHERLVASLPADKVARQEALIEKMEDGSRLTRSERTELIALEKELTAAAADLLRAQVASRTAGKL